MTEPQGLMGKCVPFPLLLRINSLPSYIKGSNYFLAKSVSLPGAFWARFGTPRSSRSSRSSTQGASARLIGSRTARLIRSTHGASARLIRREPDGLPAVTHSDKMLHLPALPALMGPNPTID